MPKLSLDTYNRARRALIRPRRLAPGRQVLDQFDKYEYQSRWLSMGTTNV